MHVKSLHVTRYGPMAPFHDDHIGAFTLIYGPNEQGKTLLIDALIKFLFKKDMKKSHLKMFGNLSRVSEQPEGFVVLQSHLEEFKLESDEQLSTVLGVDLSPEDFRNIFLIRDSDLTVRDEGNYYEDVTEKLTGLRSSEIDRLLKVIQKRGRLKSVDADSPLANNLGTDKVADAMKGALQLLEDIATLRESLVSDRFDELASDLVETRGLLRELNEERERFRQAERRARYAKARKILDELTTLSEQYDSLRHVEHEQLQQWKHLVLEREHLRTLVERESRSLDKLMQRQQRAEVELNEARTVMNNERARVNDVLTQLRPDVEDYQHRRAEFRRTESQSGLVRRATLWGTVLTALTAIAFASTGVTGLLIGAAVCGFASIAGAVSMLLTSRTHGDLEARAEVLRSRAAQFGIAVDTVLDLEAQIGDLERDLVLVRENAIGCEHALTHAKSDAVRSQERRSAAEQGIAQLNQREAKLATETGVATAELYDVEVDKKRHLQLTISSRRDLLSSLCPLGEPVPGNSQAALTAWEHEIARRLAEFSDGDTADDPSEATRVDAELGLMDERQQKLRELVKRGTNQLRHVEFKCADIGVLDETPRCRTIVELDHVTGLIQAWVDEIRVEQRTAQSVIRIFREIEAEEREKIGDFFGPDSDITPMFSRITEGRYRSVSYDAAQSQVFVERADGRVFRASSLSGGAFDQLYLTIRLSIANKLFPESKGFFIMDDPFIKADTARLRNMMTLLREFVAAGWQILYFSAKSEVVSALESDVASGAVRLIELGKTIFDDAPADVIPPAHYPPDARRRSHPRGRDDRSGPGDGNDAIDQRLFEF